MNLALYEPRFEKKTPVFGVSELVRYKLGCTVQPQKMARGLTFRI